ncbi:MAG: hypothetical protein V4819_02490 [Verrucomicrobiota bacterium]
MNTKSPPTSAIRIPSRAVSRYQAIDVPPSGSSARKDDRVVGLMKIANYRSVADERIDQPDDLAIAIPQALAACGKLFARQQVIQ